MRYLLSILLATITYATHAQVYYGVTRNGGTGGGGTIYKMEANGPTRTVVHNFDVDENPGSGFDYCQMVKAPSGKLYGVTPAGGTADRGVLFEFDPSDDSYTVKYNFADETVGYAPFGSLAFGPNGHLYGTTLNGGANWDGTIFEYDISLNTVTKRADFEEVATGNVVFAGMVLGDNDMFYGVAFLGGANGKGAIYQFDPTLNELTKKQDFAGTTNGAMPLRVPVLYDGKLYGSTFYGGTNDFGVVYEYDPSLDVLTNLHDFTDGLDGGNATSTMTVVGSLLYGTTNSGGANDDGVIYEFDPSMGTVVGIQSFDLGDTGNGNVNIMLLAPDGNLYGTAENGGAFNEGTLFQCDLTNSTLTTMLSFSAGSGSIPKSGLTLADDGLLYGSTAAGGAGGSGTIFAYNYLIDFYDQRLNLNVSSEGAYPTNAPTQHPNGKLYGTTTMGGFNNGGVIYEFDPLSNTYYVVYNFGDDFIASKPVGPLLILPSGLIYGVTTYGGSGQGTFFVFDPSNYSITLIRNFDGANDGSNPAGGLTMHSNGYIYGTTSSGGTNNQGTIFQFDPNNLSSFNKTYDLGGLFGNAPSGEMLSYNNTLFGLTRYGGSFGNGVLFEYVVGSSFGVYVEFQNAVTGGEPGGSLILADDGLMYGVTSTGGLNGDGTLFSFNPSNSSFLKRADFQMGPTGGKPTGTLAKSYGNKLYGFAPFGGAGGWGTIFEYDIALQSLNKIIDFSPATGSQPESGALSFVPVPPVITSIAPPNAVVTSGITISGSNFSPDPADNIVYIGPVRAMVSFATTTELQVVVPYGAEHGPVSVTVSGLTGESPMPFTPIPIYNGWIPGSFVSPSIQAAGAGNKRSVMADLDGDNLPDVAMANSSSALVHTFRNISTFGAPTFDGQVNFFIENSPYTLDAADIDGDGKLDLLSACGAGVVSIIRNQSTVGNISFAGSVPLSFGTTCISLTTADVDSDGKVDVIAVGANAYVRVFKNISVPGQILFSSYADFLVGAVDGGSQLWDVEVADLDGDQKVDIIVPIPDNPTTLSTVAFLRNTSVPGIIDGGTFATNVNYPAPGYTSGVDVGDLDFDGKPEIIVGSSLDFNAALSIFPNYSFVGSIQFGAPVVLASPYQVWDPKFADVDGDTRLDILAGLTGQGRIVVYRNEWTGGLLDGSQFSKSVINTGGSPLTFHVLDLDLDYKPELVVANEGTNQLQWFLNMNGARPPVIASVTPNFGAVGSSVVISGANFSPTSTVFFGATKANVTGTSPTSLTVTVPSGATFAPVSVTANGLTGISDVPFSPDFATSGVFDANSFAGKVDITVGNGPQVLAVGDLNADGKSDLLVPNNSDGTVSVLENLSTPGTLSFSKTDLTTVGGPLVAAIADIDGDNLQDFVVSGGDGYSIFRNTASSGTIVPTTFDKTDVSLGSNQVGIALADIDGDGRPDIIAAAYNSSVVWVIRNQSSPGVVSFGTPIFVSALTAAALLAVSDLDGDGRAEIVLGYANPGGALSVIQNFSDPGGIFSDQFVRTDITTGNTPYGMSLVDMDGDGKVDITYSDYPLGVTGVLRNIMSGPGTISTSSFETTVAFTTDSDPVFAVCADVDGDQRPDIVTANRTPGNISVLKNAIASTGTLSASSFDTRVDFTTSSGPGSVAVADIDGDDRPDLIAAAATGNVVSILLSDSELGVPTANAAQNVTTTSFDADWSAVTDATGYRIDVSADGFVTMAPSYDNLAVGGTSLAISGLTSGLTYEYRVRAENSTGPSGNSNVQSVTLFPEPPIVSYMAVTTDSFVASWTTPTGATAYFLDVSTDNFLTYLVGYEGRSVTGITESLSGLSSGMTYQFRVYVTNAAGPSIFSDVLSVDLVPIAPVINFVSNVTQTSFKAEWEPSPGNVDYRVDVSDSDFPSVMPAWTDVLVDVGTSLSVTGLTAGSTYKYRVRAVSASSGPSANSNVFTVQLVPATPVAIDATMITEESFQANWELAAGATEMHLDVSLDDFATMLVGYDGLVSPGDFEPVMSLQPGVTYKYRVRSANDSGESPNSNVIAVTTIPPAPVATTATSITTNSFIANWNAAPGADEYYIDVSANDFVSSIPGYDDVLVNGLSINVTGLTVGATYKYRVRASNSSGESVNSNQISVTTDSGAPGAPVATAASSLTANSFTANWDAVAGATGYQLDVSPDGFATNLTSYDNLPISGGSTSQPVVGLVGGTLYSYRVRATNLSGPSANSNVINVLMLPPAPVAKPATAVEQKSFTAMWSVDGSTDYVLDVSEDNFLSYLPGYHDFSLTGNSLLIDNLISGGTYQYRLRATNGSGLSEYSNVIEVTLKPGPPPTAEPTVVGQTSFIAMWLPTVGAQSYRIDVSTDDFVGVLPDYNDLFVNGSEQEQEIIGLTAGQFYKYRVRAVNDAGTSDNSNAVTVVTRPPDPVAIAATSATENSFDANWNDATGASEYFLYVSDDDFVTHVGIYNGHQVGAITETVTGLTPGTLYKYRVTAGNVSGPSGYSNPISVTLIPDGPLAVAATSLGENSFTANWNSALGATEYRLDVSSDNFGTVLASHNNLIVNSTSEIVTGLGGGQQYMYRVRAYNPSGISVNSNVITVLTIPPPPVVAVATNMEQTSFTANWNTTVSATGYFIDVVDQFSTPVAGFTNKPVAGTSVSVTGLTPGGIYEYVVRAENASGTSSDSNPELAKLKPADPIALAASGVGPSYFTANWDAAEGAQVYRLDVSSDNFTSMVSGFDDRSVTTTSEDVTGLPGGVLYKYRVRAVNPSGISQNSNVISVSLGAAVPEATAATNVDEGSFTANWNASDGADEYRLDVTANDFTTNLANYNDRQVTGTSLNITSGLTAGSTYLYRVRAKNSTSTSDNSNVITVSLVPEAPTALQPTLVGLTSFTANWEPSSGATKYYFDLSSNNFASNLLGYDNLETTGTSIPVSGLTTGVAYKYRVRAANSGGTSGNSNPIIVVTGNAPAVTGFTPPGGTIDTEVTVNGANFASGLTVKFNGVTATSAPTALSSTQFKILVPTGATTGKISVTVDSQTGTSVDNFIVDTTEPNVADPTGGTQEVNTQFVVSATITDPDSPISDPKMYFRSVAGSDAFQSLALNGVGPTYSNNIPASFIKESGVEYYIEASSYGGKKTTATATVQVVYPSSSQLTYTYNAFGETENSYRMFSVPLNLGNKKVSAVLEDDLEVSTKKNWRVSHYNNGANVELGSNDNIEPKLGYWLIIKENPGTPIDFGSGTALEVSRDQPATITLKNGWNQIGNPYDFKVLWQDVVDASANTGLDFGHKLATWSGGWDYQDNELGRMQGAFVESTSASDITIEIPAYRNPSAGRVGPLTAPLSANNWEVVLNLMQGDNFNKIGGFGMNKEAVAGFDRYDGPSMPRFFEHYIEVKHARQGNDRPLAMEVVPTDESYVWEFDVESNYEEDEMRFEWDNTRFGDNSKTLVLWDEQEQLATDMRLVSSYNFLKSRSKKFKVYFGESSEVAEQAIATRLVFHEVFPNPTTDGDVKVAFSVPSEGPVSFEVFDLMGRRLWNDVGSYTRGYHEIDLSGKFAVTRSNVIVQVSTDKDRQSKMLVIK